MLIKPGVVCLWLTTVCLWSVLPWHASVANELLQDPLLQRGVQLSTFQTEAAGVSRFITRQPFRNACLPVLDCSQQPQWMLQQWSTVQDIASVPAETLTHDALQWTVTDNTGRVQKRLRLGGGTAVQLELNGLSEFAARREDGIAQYLPDLRHPWPHFLLSQELQGGRLGTLQSLPLSITYEVPLDDPQRADGYDAGIHAARLVLAVTVRNRLSGNYFWLTLPLYDDRQPHTGFGCQKCTHNGERCYTPNALQDPGVWRCPEDRVGEQWWQNAKPGTARMIFRLPTAGFVQQTGAGRYVVAGDLLPYIHAGIDAVRARHNGRTFPADLFFYELGRFSVGWEITGFNHVTAAFHRLSLQEILKPDLAGE